MIFIFAQAYKDLVPLTGRLLKQLGFLASEIRHSSGTSLLSTESGIAPGLVSYLLNQA